jgi:putative two-component system response regulator
VVLSERVLKESRVWIIDDDAANVALVERLLEWAGFSNSVCFTSGAAALEALDRMSPDLILLDLRMPDVDGYDLLRRIYDPASTHLSVPTLVFSGDGSKETRKRALELGASDFLTKPGDSTEILLRVRNFLKSRHMHRQLEEQNQILEERIRERTRSLEQLQRELIQRLAIAAEYRDDETGEHAQRVGELAGDIAEELGLPEEEVQILRLASPLHDIGKIGIPDEVLLKREQLNAEERRRMEEHAEIGRKILAGSQSPFLSMAETIAISHHERWDGKGYPAGLAGEDIPLVGRIVAISDVYDALTSQRPYKEAWTPDQAADYIKSESGAAFDPTAVEAFLRVMARRRLDAELPLAS